MSAVPAQWYTIIHAARFHGGRYRSRARRLLNGFW